MRIRLLPGNVIHPKEVQTLTSYLIDEAVAVDAGSLGLALPMEDMARVRNIVITHTHMDHIASLPIFISEVFPFLDEPVTVFATRESIAAMRTHIFNGIIWPDFEGVTLLNGRGPAVRFEEIIAGSPFSIGHLRFTAVCTNHTVPTVGLAIEDALAAVVLSSDTHITDELWRLANSLKRLRAIFVDVSYPNELADLAERSRHLTPELLDGELRKVTSETAVYAVHVKPQYAGQIVRQLQALGRANLHVGEIDEEYRFC